MKLEIDIPDDIYRALKNGLGRDLISHKFGLSSTDARKFTGAYELSNIKNKRDFYEITESDEVEDSAKVLLFDIETAPIEALVWGTQKQFIQPVQIKRDWCLLTWSAKWLHDTEMMSDRVTSKEALDRNDERIVRSLWNLLNEADIVIAHYGDKFDIRRMNGRFFLYEMRLPSPYQSIDTCKTAQSRMHLTSYKLDEVGGALGVGRKIKTEFKLWADCDKGDVSALKEMEKYNRQDVVLLEDVYLKLRPYIKNHPNMGLFIDSDNPCCPVCTSRKIIDDGYYCTSVSKFPAYYCNECFAPLRSRKSIVSKEKRKDLTVSLAR